MKMVYVSQRVDTIEAYAERRDALDQRWTDFLMKSGAVGIPLPNNVRAVQEMLLAAKPAGILLTGGNSPVQYGGSAPERDAVDALLLRYAETSTTPVIGICRGMQSILLHYGGTLQPVEGHVAQRHDVCGHIVRNVNSYHNFAAVETPEPLQVLAKAGDFVEAVKHRTLPLVGIMWHPEREDPFHAEDVRLLKTYWNMANI